jgi:hypothetical protein
MPPMDDVSQQPEPEMPPAMDTGDGTFAYTKLEKLQATYLESTILLATLQSEGHTDLMSIVTAMPDDAPQMAWDILEHYRRYNKTPMFDRTPYKPHGVLTAGEGIGNASGRPRQYDKSSETDGPDLS